MGISSKQNALHPCLPKFPQTSRLQDKIKISFHNTLFFIKKEKEHHVPTTHLLFTLTNLVSPIKTYLDHNLLWL